MNKNINGIIRKANANGEPEPGEEEFVMDANAPINIQTVGNSIYFYDYVTDRNLLIFNTIINTMQKNILINMVNLDLTEPPRIKLYIKSNGGDAFAGFSMMDAVLNSSVPIDTYIDGMCASAATLVALAGKKKYMTKHSYVLIHQLRAYHYGTYESQKDNMENSEKMMEMLKRIYKEYTKIPTKKINEILKKDIYFNAEEALAYGLIDQIL